MANIRESTVNTVEECPAHYYLYDKEVGCESLGPQPPQGQEYFQKLSCVFNRP